MSERLNKSIEILEKTAKEIEDKKISEKKKADTERTGMMQKIRDLRPRITDLIKAGQKCQELGIDFPICFEADDVNHDLGFISKNSQIRYLGIKNGGFNGPWDFYTDGVESFSVSNNDYSKGAIEDSQIPDMKKFLNQFLNQFGLFESAFYQWIESLNTAEEDTDEAAPGECVKRISLRNLYENGIKSLTFGGTEGIIFRDGRYVLEHNALPFIEDGEELKFQFFADAGDGERFALGTSKEEHGVYFTRKEYELAVENPAFLKLPSFIELGKTYKFAGYDWTACELINKGKTLVIQSHGVTSGAWPGYVMQKFGGKANAFYGSDIDGDDISAYDDKMQELYDAINDAEDSSTSYGKGLFLISKEKAGFTEWREPGSGNYWQALKEASMNYQPFGAADGNASLGTVYVCHNAWYVYSDGYVYTDGNQDYDFVVAPAFNLDLSKIEVAGDKIMIKGTFEKTNTGKSLALEKRVKKARLILAVTEQVSEDNFERHYKTVEIEVPENEHMNLSKCDIIGGEWIS